MMKTFMERLPIGRKTFATRALACAAIAQLVAAFPRQLHAQETDTLPTPTRFSVGGFAGLGGNLYFGSVDLGSSSKFGAGNCGVFNSGFGLGGVAGVLVEYRLTDGFTLGLRGIYNGSNGAMRTPNAAGAQFRKPDGSLAQIESEHTYLITNPSAGGELYGAIRPFNLPLTLRGGVRLAQPLSPTYELQEEIVEPAEAYFDNGTQTRKYGSGALNDGTEIGVIAGAGWPLKIGDFWELIPELTLSTTLTSFQPRGNPAIRHRPSRRWR
ncbi:MAG: hypothetical protein UZ07_CHB004000510, partial [Chlorobi bacterium OLB7]